MSAAPIRDGMVVMAAKTDWAGKIRVAWQKSVAAIFEVGDLLNAAKKTVPRGQFTTMIESKLPFGERTAQMLMGVADDPRLRNPKQISLLPPSWGTLYALSQLTDKQFKAALIQGMIKPDMSRADVMAFGQRSLPTARVPPSPAIGVKLLQVKTTRTVVPLVTTPSYVWAETHDADEPAPRRKPDSAVRPRFPSADLFGDADHCQLESLIEQAARAVDSNSIDAAASVARLEQAGQKLLTLAERLRAKAH
jgi:hypothetical protein